MPEDRSIEDLVDAVGCGRLELPGWDAEFEQTLARINLVSVVAPDLGYPAFGEAGRRDFLRVVLSSVERLEQMDLGAGLAQFIGAERRQWLDDIAPRVWRLAGGGKAPIEYSRETDPAEGVAYSPTVRMSEVLLAGVDYHPFVCEGKVAVRVCVIDREGRVMQETLDWPGFRRGRPSAD